LVFFAFPFKAKKPNIKNPIIVFIIEWHEWMRIIYCFQK